MVRFAMRFDRVSRWILSLLGMGPPLTGIWIGDGRVQVRMGWAFALDAAAHAVRSAELVTESVSRRFLTGIGVHGWGGRWRVNGAFSPIVRIRFEPAQRARVILLPLRVHTVEVSAEDPDALIAALAPARR